MHSLCYIYLCCQVPSDYLLVLNFRDSQILMVSKVKHSDGPSRNQSGSSIVAKSLLSSL